MVGMGICVFDLPLLKICPKPLTAIEQRHSQALLVGGYQALVVVSPNACRFGVGYYNTKQLTTLATLSQGTLSVVAVGKATQTCLTQHALHVLTPDVPSNEAMATMPALSRLGVGARVLFWQGVGGRTFLRQALADNGVAVDSVAWYERKCPDDLVNQGILLAKLLKTKRVMMVIACATAWQHWCKLAGTLDIDWRGIIYLTLGNRLTTLVATHAQAILIDNLTDEHLWRTITTR